MALDRRHVVLVAAVVATLAEKTPSYSLFEGYERLDVGPLAIEAGATVTWIVTGTIDLPPEARSEAYSSSIDMAVDVEGSDDRPRQVSIAVRECDSQAVLAEARFPADVDTGTMARQPIEIDGVFADCPTEEPCVRELCLDAANEEAESVGLALEIWADVSSHEDAPEDGTPIDVPITLTFEEAP